MWPCIEKQIMYINGLRLKACVGQINESMVNAYYTCMHAFTDVYVDRHVQVKCLYFYDVLLFYL